MKVLGLAAVFLFLMVCGAATAQTLTDAEVDEEWDERQGAAETEHDHGDQQHRKPEPLHVGAEDRDIRLIVGDEPRTTSHTRSISFVPNRP